MSRDQDRLRYLTDDEAYLDDGQYHHLVRTFSRWMEMTRWALADEGIDPTTTERVLNRLVFGAPDPADAYRRKEDRDAYIKMLTTTPFKWSP